LSCDGLRHLVNTVDPAARQSGNLAPLGRERMIPRARISVDS
jgi:hypothetical protein